MSTWLNPTVVAAVCQSYAPNGFRGSAQWDLINNGIKVSIWLPTSDGMLLSEFNITDEELASADVGHTLSKRARAAIDAVMALTVPT